jgi:hypothetical protein
MGSNISGIGGGSGGGGGYPTAAAAGILAARATGQTFTYVANTPQKLTLSTVTYDAASYYSTGTGRYTPTVAGYYLVYGVVSAPEVANAAALAYVYKNGASFALGSVFQGNAFGTLSAVRALVFLNGSTDYVELWGSCNAAGTTNVNAGTFMRLEVSRVAA